MNVPPQQKAGQPRLPLTIGLVCLTAMLATAGGTLDPLTTSRAALEDELYELAERECEQFIKTAAKKDAQRPEAYTLLAQALYGQGRYQDLLTRLEKQLNAAPDSAHHPALIFWYAMSEYRTGRARTALERIADFDTTYPTSTELPRVRRLRAWCLVRMGQTKEAITAFEGYDKAHPDDAERAQNLLDWSKILISADQLDDARITLARILDQYATSATALRARYWLAQLQAETGEWDRALTNLHGIAQNTIATPGAITEAWLSIADIHESRRGLSDAVVALEQALGSAPNVSASNNTFVILGQLLLRMDRIEDGIAYLKRFITAATDDPLAPRMQLKLSQALLDKGIHDRAAEEYQHYLDSFTDDDGHAQALYGKGWSLFLMGNRYAEAAAMLDKAADVFVDPTVQAECLFKVGDCYYKNEQFSLATGAYDRVIRTFPGSELVPRAHYQIAQSLLSAGAAGPAETVFRHVASLGANSELAPLASLRIGEILEDRKRPVEAIERYNQVLAEYTNRAIIARAIHRRGGASYQLFRFGDALADFQRVGEEFPQDAVAEHALYMAGMCHFMLVRNEESKRIWQTFLDRYPASDWAPLVLYHLGEQAYNQRDLVAAESNFLALADQYTAEPLADDALLWAGRAALEQKSFLRANDHFARLTKEHADSAKISEARFFQGEAWCGRADFSSAIVIFDELIKEAAGGFLVDMARVRKGDCQFSLGIADPERYEEAIESYRVAAASSSAPMDVILYAQFMSGRCLEQLDRVDQALEQYYKHVVIRYTHELAGGAWPNDKAQTWFARAAFNAADILRGQKKWRNAVQVLTRVSDANVPASADAREQTEEIRSKRWWMFY